MAVESSQTEYKSRTEVITLLEYEVSMLSRLFNQICDKLNVLKSWDGEMPEKTITQPDKPIKPKAIEENEDGIASPKVFMFPDGRMDCKNAALYLGVSDKTLATKRSIGDGPKYIKRGRIFYYKDDLDEWMKKIPSVSTSQERFLNKDKE